MDDDWSDLSSARQPLSATVEQAVHETRAGLLEAVAQLEVYVDQALATYLAPRERLRTVLYRDLVWYAPLAVRIAVLRELLEEDDWLDKFPFLVHLDELVDTRNVLAHMLLDTFRSTDRALVFRGRRRGDERQRELLVERLRGLLRVADGARANLFDLISRLHLQRP